MDSTSLSKAVLDQLVNKHAEASVETSRRGQSDRVEPEFHLKGTGGLINSVKSAVEKGFKFVRTVGRAVCSNPRVYGRNAAVWGTAFGIAGVAAADNGMYQLRKHDRFACPPPAFAHPGRRSAFSGYEGYYRCGDIIDQKVQYTDSNGETKWGYPVVVGVTGQPVEVVNQNTRSKRPDGAPFEVDAWPRQAPLDSTDSKRPPEEFLLEVNDWPPQPSSDSTDNHKGGTWVAREFAHNTRYAEGEDNRLLLCIAMVSEEEAAEIEAATKDAEEKGKDPTKAAQKVLGELGIDLPKTVNSGKMVTGLSLASLRVFAHDHIHSIDIPISERTHLLSPTKLSSENIPSAFRGAVCLVAEQVLSVLSTLNLLTIKELTPVRNAQGEMVLRISLDKEAMELEGAEELFQLELSKVAGVLEKEGVVMHLPPLVQANAPSPPLPPLVQGNAPSHPPVFVDASRVEMERMSAVLLPSPRGERNPEFDEIDRAVRYGGISPEMARSRRVKAALGGEPRTQFKVDKGAEMAQRARNQQTRRGGR